MSKMQHLLINSIERITGPLVYDQPSQKWVLQPKQVKKLKDVGITVTRSYSTNSSLCILVDLPIGKIPYTINTD